MMHISQNESAHYRLQSNLSYFHSIQGSPAAASRKNAAHGACPCNKQLLQAATIDVLAHSMCKRAVEPMAKTSSSMRKKTDSKLQFQKLGSFRAVHSSSSSSSQICIDKTLYRKAIQVF